MNDNIHCVGSVVFVLFKKTCVISPGILSEILTTSDVDGVRTEYGVVLEDGQIICSTPGFIDVYFSVSEIEEKLLSGAMDVISKIISRVDDDVKKLLISTKIEEKLLQHARANGDLKYQESNKHDS